MATQAARPSEITVVIAARPTRPSCEAAAEKSAVMRAADRTAMATPKLRHPGRSIPRHQDSATCIDLKSFAAAQLTVDTVYPSRIENQPANVDLANKRPEIVRQDRACTSEKSPARRRRYENWSALTAQKSRKFSASEHAGALRY